MFHFRRGEDFQQLGVAPLTDAVSLRVPSLAPQRPRQSAVCIRLRRYFRA